MALFSLLIAILVERLKVLPADLQFDHLLGLYHRNLFRDEQIKSVGMMALALLFPALTLYVLCWVFAGLFWGVFSLLLWVAVAVLCFTHKAQRDAFKRYVQAACRGDTQACYHYAGELECHDYLDAVDPCELAMRVGQSVAWINYRYYGAVALYLIVAGPIGAVLYCTVRFYSEEKLKRKLDLPLVDELLFLLDWIPSRLFAFGYVLCGEFSESIDAWRKLVIRPGSSARDIIVQTAVAAEPQACDREEGISLQPTIAMLALSKRNVILMVCVLSLLTIFGLVS
ncbi:MAG: beta-lactamase regulator AmpE [Shewanella sp.]|nr:beta-lactamase regulator AmpE [Shewanella sp.]MCF1430807.1 beta-lactamase regulator AmpE [Shewanella sp.]MCF1437396.1 beta-lactamase regulator AmpE [Shewanella sp.]MCF1458586.1 beta-lactamase regulator AmpE [Shewanella sp.]